jgi:16S rRNA (uracil1498-N3)-methyltransferase
MDPLPSEFARLPRFLLAEAPRVGARAPLAEGELHHAARVLRLAPGDRALGLDGRGRAWPLEALRGQGRRGELELFVQAEPWSEPAPGAPGSPLPAIELCFPWPRPGREEALLERATQLGAARLRPLLCARTGPEDRAGRARRAERVLLQTLKQSRGLWAPELLEAAPPAELPSFMGREVCLDPGAETPLLACLSSEPLAPLRLWIGPEGGFSPAEQESLAERGAQTARLGPFVLRIETAVEAALAVAVAVAEAAGR